MKKTLQLYRIFMWLVALHSFSVGLALVLIPMDIFPVFGFQGYEGTFFKIQGGIFHMVMCGAYLPAGLDPYGKRFMLRFAVFAKLTATAFLLSYYLVADRAWMVLVSGLGDLMMAIILIWFDRRLTRPAGSAH